MTITNLYNFYLTSLRDDTLSYTHLPFEANSSVAKVLPEDSMTISGALVIVVSFVHRTATISIFLSDAKCSSICRAQTCAHSGVESSRSAKAFLQGGPKSSKNFRIFHHFETLRPYISENIKIRGEAVYGRKPLSLPYPTVACIWTHRSRGSTG